MNSKDLLQRALSYIHNCESAKIQELMNKHQDIIISIYDFEAFVYAFSHNFKELEQCININGSGGSLIPKLNITSIACLYIAAITRLKIAKTGSAKNTSMVGSSDFFRSLGLLSTHNKLNGLHKYSFCYYDHTELAPWKLYKELLSQNKSLCEYIQNGVFFEYSANIYGIGISKSNYMEKLEYGKIYNKPQTLFSYYTNTSYGMIDEIMQGDVYVNGNYLLSIKGDIYIPNNSSEIINEGIKLVYGTSNNNSAIESLRYTVAIILSILTNYSIDEGIKLFNIAFKRKTAGILIENLKALYI